MSGRPRSKSCAAADALVWVPVVTLANVVGLMLPTLLSWALEPLRQWRPASARNDLSCSLSYLGYCKTLRRTTIRFEPGED
jgi:hypothetical protein